jgi:hypothetical protein
MRLLSHRCWWFISNYSLDCAPPTPTTPRPNGSVRLPANTGRQYALNILYAFNNLSYYCNSRNYLMNNTCFHRGFHQCLMIILSTAVSRVSHAIHTRLRTRAAPLLTTIHTSHPSFTSTAARWPRSCHDRWKNKMLLIRNDDHWCLLILNSCSQQCVHCMHGQLIFAEPTLHATNIDRLMTIHKDMTVSYHWMTVII